MNTQNEYVKSAYPMGRIVSGKDTYKDFHSLYKHIQLALVGDFIETPQLDELVTELYWIARGEIADLHEPDDEYGTGFFCGKNMDYGDCEMGMLRAVQMLGFEVYPVFYDGELNSVYLKEVKSVHKAIRANAMRSEDDDLPF